MTDKHERCGKGVICGTVETVTSAAVGQQGKTVWTIRVWTGRYRDKDQFAQFQTWDNPGPDVRKGATVEADVRLSARQGNDGSGRWWVDVTATSLTVLEQAPAAPRQAPQPAQPGQQPQPPADDDTNGDIGDCPF